MYAIPPNPTPSMYCAVLNTARIRLLRRTMTCETSPVTNAIAIGQGGANNIADARNGMNTTEEPTRALETRGFGRKEESLAMPRIVNAISAFQNELSSSDGTYHVVTNKRPRAATPTPAQKSRNVQRSRLGWLLVISHLAQPRKMNLEGEEPHITLELCCTICEKQLRDCREQKSEQLQHRASPP